MCTPNNDIKFCTCAEGDIYEIKNIYIWTLESYIGSNETMRLGKIMLPTDNFGNGISTENIIQELKAGNIFDFDYIPQERDTLRISYNAENHNDYKYFSLIFINNNWQEGRNPAFRSIEKNIAAGEIIINQKKQ
ncbi:hypothetical protein ACQWU4_15060 [Chryseobacterium sp. MIQD13]|uniref:hypothetical protein n=1 Tax=Chryseobacterium sp. MIQD13 TaxID=3422310 RepID=UPI003D27FADE